MQCRFLSVGDHFKQTGHAGTPTGSASMPRVLGVRSVVVMVAMFAIGMAVSAVTVRNPVTPMPAPVTVGDPIVASPVTPAIITAPGIVAARPVTRAIPATPTPITGIAVVRWSPIGTAISIPIIGAVEGDSGCNPGGNT